MKKRLLKGAVLAVCCMLISVLSVSFVLAADARPGKPKLVYAEQVSGGLGVLLAWKDGENTRKTEIYRSKNGGSYKKVGETGAKDGSCYFEEVTEGVFRYKIRGVNGKNKGAFSAVKKVTVKKLNKYDRFKRLLMLCEVSAEVGAKKGEPALVDSLVNGFSGDGYSSIAKILAKDSKTLRFELVEKQGKEQISVTMDLNESAVRKGKTQVTISVNVPSASQVYRTTATVNISGIKKAEDLAFRTEGGKSVTAAQKKVSAGILHSGFRRWEDIMRSDANSSLRDLGFTRLQDIMIENKSK